MKYIILKSFIFLALSFFEKVIEFKKMDIYMSNKIDNSYKEEDTCKFPKNSTNNYERFGFVIKSNFILDKFKTFDLDNNGVNDTIAILSPWELNSDYDFCPKRDIDSIENRILVINLYDQQGKIIQKFKFDNIISKDISYPIFSGAENVKLKKDYYGFILQKSIGQGYKNEYFIFCSYNKNLNDFFIDRILFNGIRPSEKNDIRKTISFKKEEVYLKMFDRNFIEETLENL